MLLSLPADEVSKRRDGNQQLLDQYSAAVCLRQAHDLDATVNASLARIGMESDSFAAARVIAGLTDPSVAAVQDTIDRLNAAAQASRQASMLGSLCLTVTFVLPNASPTHCEHGPSYCRWLVTAIGCLRWHLVRPRCDTTVPPPLRQLNLCVLVCLQSGCC